MWLVTERTFRAAGPTAAVVGTVLAAVNRGSVVSDGQAAVVTWVRIVVNYLVPYCVANIGYLAVRRAR